MTTKELAFTKKFETAKALAERVGSLTVKNVEEYRSAEGDLKTIRALEKELDEEYKAHPIIVEAKRIQAIKGDLATMLENARKSLKNGPMLRYEREEESKRLAEENRLAEIARKEQAAERARQVEEQRQAWLIAEKARKAAEKKGDDEAAERARIAAAQAAEAAKEIKAVPIVVPVVVVEKTAPSVPRRMVPKFRVTDESKVPHQYFSLDNVKVGGVIRSLRQNHGIPGIEYYEEPA